MIREALPNEFPEAGEKCWILEDSEGKTVGHVMFSVLNGAPFIHALKHWGDDPMGLARLVLTAEEYASARHQEVYVNLSADAHSMLHAALRRGYQPLQLIMRRVF